MKALDPCALLSLVRLFATLDCSPPDYFVGGESPGKDAGEGLPCPPPGHLPNPGMEPGSPAWKETVSATREAP